MAQISGGKVTARGRRNLAAGGAARIDKKTTAPMMGRVLPVGSNRGPNMKSAK